MSAQPPVFDVFVIGSGPAGQKAAIGLAKGGLKVALCERMRQIGGACVHQGTIPSKALRERAVERGRVNERLSELGAPELDRATSIAELIGETSEIMASHDAYITEQLARNGVEIVHGRARFESASEVQVLTTTGQQQTYRAHKFVIAAGSRPRHPDEVGVDHEHIYDSDSVLSMAYLPESMVVLGGGVIACEYASIFSVLGVDVTLIDRYPMPLGFLDQSLTERFMRSFKRRGGVFLGESEVVQCGFDGLSSVVTELSDGRQIRADKVLCAQGRIADLSNLNVEAVGLKLNERGLLDVDEFCQTQVPHIYAAGDVIGPPSLASASMEQGRQIACHILGYDIGTLGKVMPSGIYSIPELASVGLTEAQAQREFDQVVVGFSDFSEIARGHIANAKDGMLKMVVDGDGVVRGVHVVGMHASDLVHIGQMGMLHDATVDVYIENVFNFPTYAEGYRVAAIDAAAKLAQLRATAPAQTG